MLSRDRWFVALVVIVSALSPAVSTQSGSPQAVNSSLANRPVSSASRITEAPSIDGALDEGVWQNAVPLTSFVQAEPFEGAPASEHTEVKILYDDEAIYVGVVLHDRDPSLIVTTDTRRDANLEEMDSFQMIFDTFRDQQNGFVFGTNAAGVQYDAQVRDQDDEESWDGSWDVRTSTNATNWVAEFRIPLRTLRYGPAPQTWGVNFFRNIQRTRERAYWSALPREHDLERLSSAGELRGLELKTPRNFKLLPYVLGSANRNFTPGATTEGDGDFGFDSKFGITPSLNLDLTYNTDFAQVEVDTEQINLTRFNLRFPEKRPFFLENSGLFTIGKEDEIDLFFSRRIGRKSGADQGRRASERQGEWRQCRRAKHADRRCRVAVGEQFFGSSRQPRAAQSIRHWCDVRESIRDRRPCAVERLEPYVWTRRACGRWRALHGGGLRRAHRDAGTQRPRLRLQRRLGI
jgi:hypothetical protein